ncbi:MAG TPA: geranylgeranylglycerol-phosphate geranylgeranyltransferase [Ferruginibacter sp.]|nr:geranylgeranylglycerol-phosphate geranylgeranyltransferase [Ferruginibacter sp.]
MKLLSAFLRLVRWPNLVFIGLTQWLYFSCVFEAVIHNPVETQYPLLPVWLLMAASILIAAGGYIINDYFDMHIDSVNKPDKVVVDKHVKRRWAIFWHMLFSMAGLFISAFISWRSGTWLILAGNIFCVILLWFYSTTFKKKLLIGNIIISALTAWVILVFYFYFSGGLYASATSGWYNNHHDFDIRRLFKFTILYAGFAFILSVVREVVKDLEDMQGDAQYNCNTMPIAWGVPASKVFSAVWIVVAAAALAIVQFYAWQSGWWPIVLYCILLVIGPLLLILRKLQLASQPADYRHISNLIKWVMLAGILSMLFFKFLV